MKKLSLILFFTLIYIHSLFSYTKEFGPFHTTLVKKEVYTSPSQQNQPSTPSWVFQQFIRIFQIYISPQDGPNCRYHPTCSRYAYIAINDYGPLLGVIMTSDRYLRCNPFGAWGPDRPSENYFFNHKK